MAQAASTKANNNKNVERKASEDIAYIFIENLGFSADELVLTCTICADMIFNHGCQSLTISNKTCFRNHYLEVGLPSSIYEKACFAALLAFAQ
ncbi:hypothetical protein KUL49_23100 [Alteromonas sp. KUL49]|nr:hypothetical protein KUL49_23100 [Alteromonas sp. KUL49]